MLRKILFWVISLVILGVGVWQVKNCENWEWVKQYGIVSLVWLLFMWIWPNRQALRHDIDIISACDSPFKLEWMGSMVLLIAVCMALVVGAICFIGYFLISFWNLIYLLI